MATIDCHQLTVKCLMIQLCVRILPHKSQSCLHTFN